MTHAPLLLDDRPALAAALRDKLGMSNSYASELANGRRLPSLTLAARIEKALFIPPAAWIGHQEACERSRTAA